MECLLIPRHYALTAYILIGVASWINYRVVFGPGYPVELYLLAVAHALLLVAAKFYVGSFTGWFVGRGWEGRARWPLFLIGAGVQILALLCMIPSFPLAPLAMD